MRKMVLAVVVVTGLSAGCPGVRRRLKPICFNKQLITCSLEQRIRRRVLRLRIESRALLWYVIPDFQIYQILFCPI